MTLLTIPTSTTATPLIALTAVVVDTEATSLDIKTSRVIEIGAVALVNGAIDPAHHFEQLANPGQPIPAASTSIHGITDADVAEAATFKQAFTDFRQFAGAHVWLGFALDFDVALLAQECQRNTIAFKTPVALDVRSLVRIIRPTLPDYALETIAQWQGITPKNRHRALGDAQLTAEVYLALLPLLRERGIRTFGEALAASRKLDEQSGQLHAIAQATPQALTRVDSFPYRHRVEDLMSLPPVTISPDQSLAEAIDLMIERRVSSLIVTGSEPGIFTERDGLRALAKDKPKGFALKMKSVASFPLLTVRTSDFAFTAIGLMRRRAIRHLGVVDDKGQLVGALSQRDLLRFRADEAIALSSAMSDAATPAALAGVWRKLADAARSLLDEDVDARDIAAIISGEVCALTARAAAMAEAEQAATRPKDLRFAIMVLGSGGRGESLLALDQDNALIFEATDHAAAQTWLEPFANRMNAILDEIGVPLCKGGVMAKNSAWRMPSPEWREKVERWLSRTNPDDILNADIFFDNLSVHGEAELADTLRDDAISAAAQSEAFLKLMSLKAADAGKSLNWLGRLVTEEDGRMDLKRLGLMPVFSAARVLALRYRVHARSTRERLASLRGNPAVPQSQLEAISEAHGELLQFVLRQQLEDIARGVPPSNRVSPSSLSTLQRDRLKWCLHQVASISDLLGTPQV